MQSGTETAISRVIDSMREHLGEPFSTDEMADLAQFSKFHFSRIFQLATGLPPARFLAAVRLSEAKRLLLTTSLTVTEIGIQVGYTSASSFSSRFKNSVGMAPLAFRAHHGIRPHSERTSRPPSPRGATVRGRVLLPPDAGPGLLYLGLFPGPICDGTPVGCTVLSGPDEFEICHVPSGTWHLLGYLSKPPGQDRLYGKGFRSTEPEWRSASTPISVSEGTTTEVPALTFHRPRPMDPPILSAPWEATLPAGHRREPAADDADLTTKPTCGSSTG